ncbi:class I SAM-dependent methyltransferase [Nostoc sp.]|uniref:class I SAM-dependent methyltransferase n=1 Tax=Nostoc sp. TaxID=1180 RepID=UPI002FFA73AC
MSATKLHLNYDVYARIYNERNGQSLCEMALQPLEKLLLPHLSPGAHILDLCCGTGQLAQQLNLKGYKVTGIDISEGMLDYAQKNAPDCYSRTEIQAALESVGFRDIKVYDAELDFDIHDWGPGKAYFIGCKQPTKLVEFLG